MKRLLASASLLALLAGPALAASDAADTADTGTPSGAAGAAQTGTAQTGTAQTDTAQTGTAADAQAHGDETPLIEQGGTIRTVVTSVDPVGGSFEADVGLGETFVVEDANMLDGIEPGDHVMVTYEGTGGIWHAIAIEHEDGPVTAPGAAADPTTPQQTPATTPQQAPATPQQ